MTIISAFSIIWLLVRTCLLPETMTPEPREEVGSCLLGGRGENRSPKNFRKDGLLKRSFAGVLWGRINLVVEKLSTEGTADATWASESLILFNS